MTPIRYDGKLRRGDSFRIGFRVAHIDPDTGVKTYDYDFTGWTGEAQLRRNVDHPLILLTFTVAIADQVTTPGMVWVTASAALTALLDEESGEYDVQLTSPSGDVMTIAEGTLQIVPDVTRP